MEARGGGAAGGGERTGGDIRGAEGSVDRETGRRDSSEDGAAGEMKRRTCRDESPGLSGEDEDETGVP